MIKRIILFAIVSLILSSCGGNAVSKASSSNSPVDEMGILSISSAVSYKAKDTLNSAENTSNIADKTTSFINPSGKTLIKRVLTPVIQ